MAKARVNLGRCFPEIPFEFRSIGQSCHRPAFPVTMRLLEVHFTPEQEAQLAPIATSAGIDAERLVKDAALRILQGDTGFRATPSEGVVAAMRALRARVKPDPEGWTTRDYILHGRRWMALVVDASVALAWALPDESSPYADAVLTAVEQDGLRVPELWARELANGLAVAYLRRRITPADESAFLLAHSYLSIDVEEPVPAVTAVRNGAAAAIRYGLTAYDAAYVALAARENLTLATLDTAMRRAAE
jgi:predicted nucleic acid-binding protein